jgi:hypothetical protein
MRRFPYLFVLVMLFAAVLVSCSSGDDSTEEPPIASSPTEVEPIDEENCLASVNNNNSGGGVIYPSVRLARMSLDGELTEIGSVTVPFLEDQDTIFFLNILADLNQDGVWEASSGETSEWVVNNAPILILGTSQTAHFPIGNSALDAFDLVTLRIVVGEEPIQPDAEWDCKVSTGDIALDLEVALAVVDIGILADPAEGYVGGGAFCPASVAMGVDGPPADDVNFDTVFYRPGVPDLDQGQNTCVAHSMANSISWLAQQNGFTDKFQQKKDAQGNELDTYDVTTAEGANELAWEMISDWSDKKKYTPATGVSSDAIVSGKQDFINKRGLPITAEQIGSEDGASTFNDIKEALKDGCDVEVVLRVETESGPKAHMVTVVGFSDVKIGETPFSGLTFHDPGTTAEASGPGGGNDLYEYDPKTHSISNFPFLGKLRKATLAFAVKECYTPPKVSMSGIYGVHIQVALDILNHAIHILMGSSMDLAVRQSDITFEGAFPWVTVIGTVDEDGFFEASGRGTVAGFGGIAVTFVGSIQDEHLEGDYTMGAEGGLPGGEPIVYHVEGDRTGPLDVETGAEEGRTLVEAFFDRFNANFSAQSSEGLFYLLHPAVIDLYGAEACQAYLAEVVQNVIQVEVLSSTGPEVWQWEIDERTTAIENAFTVLANVIVGDSTNQRDLHIADDVNGTLKWFTDCGDPLS